MDWKQLLKDGHEILNFPIFKLGGIEVTAASLLFVGLILLLTLFVSRLLRGALIRVVKRRGSTDEGTLAVAARLLHYTVLFVGFGIALNTAGINLTAFFAAGALFAVAIGFAMQNLTANFVSGLILLLERAIKPGDVLEVEGEMVKVQSLGIRATIARSLDEEDLIIPNSTLVQSTVKNYTFRDTFYRLRTVVGVTYSSDLRLVRKTLAETLDSLDWVAESYEPVVLLSEFGDSSVNFEVSVWIDDPWPVRRRRSQLNEAIWWAFADRGIVIAFPQVDVHFDPPVVESLAALKRSA